MAFATSLFLYDIAHKIYDLVQKFKVQEKLDCQHFFLRNFSKSKRQKGRGKQGVNKYLKKQDAKLINLNII